MTSGPPELQNVLIDVPYCSGSQLTLYEAKYWLTKKFLLFYTLPQVIFHFLCLGFHGVSETGPHLAQAGLKLET